MSLHAFEAQAPCPIEIISMRMKARRAPDPDGCGGSSQPHWTIRSSRQELSIAQVLK